MTVVKRPRDQEPEEAFEIPAALAAELEAMNARIMTLPEYPVDEEEQIDVAEPQMAQEPEPSLADYRLEILGKAAHIVSLDRNNQYGNPEDTFATIAALWNAYLGEENLLTTDVAAMLALLKIARLQANPGHEDSWIDLAGYAACGASNAKVLLEQAEQA